MIPITLLKKIFGIVSSLKTAIPLLVITIAVTIAGSLFPEPDLFETWWYLGLLGLNGISLLFITILHIPMILERKGRNALIGVVLTHLGILILIAGAIYGGMSGFRYEMKAIEGEMTIVPGLPFVIRLDKLVIEEYPLETGVNTNQAINLKKRQDSHISLFKNGAQWIDFVARPGSPAKVDGITILPLLNDSGWYFELIATDPIGRQKTIPVKPWAPPLIKVGAKNVMVHSLMDEDLRQAQVFTIEDEQMIPLGIVSNEHVLDIDGYTISLGAYKRYTGLTVYNRPHAWVLVIGCLAMMFGLVWHFYFRHRDRSLKNKGKEQMDTGSSPA
jgi:cytochrome c biogenesis protein ResB